MRATRPDVGQPRGIRASAVVGCVALGLAAAAVAGPSCTERVRPFAPDVAPGRPGTAGTRASGRDRAAVAPGDPACESTPPGAGGSPPSADADVFRIVPEGTKAPTEPKRLRGRVVDAAGVALAGVKVELNATWLPADDAADSTTIEPGQSWCVLEWTGSCSSAVSSADGTFSVRCIDGGARALYVAGERGRLRFIAYDPPLDAEATVVVAPWTSYVEGTVESPDGTRVEGADVWVTATSAPVPFLREFQMHHCDPPGWGAHAVTDDLGHWRIDGTPDVPLAVRAEAAGRSPDGAVLLRSAEQSTPAPAAGRAWIALRLQPAASAPVDGAAGGEAPRDEGR